MNDYAPRLSIGLPVYNGENFLRCALDSILGQTFSDFELIIADNASTDATPEICCEYAARDRRIRYSRNPENLGATRNYNLVFELASAPYFKWAAHDDVLAPTFLEECVAVLDADPTVILCHSKAARIDEQGEYIGAYGSKMNFDQATPHERYHDLIFVHHPCTAVFGVVRREAMLKTGLIGNYVGSDRTLLAELGLLGRIYEIPEHLFYRRDHNGASIALNKYERLKWFDPKKARQFHLPTWKMGLEYFKLVNRVPLPLNERLTCYRYTAFWFRRERKHLLTDLKVAAQHILP